MKEVRLYDSKSKRLEVLKPLVDGKVSIYCCGPTVYNHAHAGNVRPMIVFDNLRRMLKAIGYDVLFISLSLQFSLIASLIILSSTSV